MTITINITKNEMEALNVFTPSQLEVELKNMIAEKGFFFGQVRWCDEDIEGALRENGVPVTPENVDVIKRKCEHHRFTDAMIETGWDYINSYIDELITEKEDK